MSVMTIDSDEKLEIAQDFLNFIQIHNRVAKDRKVKQSLQEAISLIDEKNAEIRRLRKEIEELEQDLRVTKDLLRVAGAINDDTRRD